MGYPKWWLSRYTSVDACILGGILFRILPEFWSPGSTRKQGFCLMWMIHLKPVGSFMVTLDILHINTFLNTNAIRGIGKIRIVFKPEFQQASLPSVQLGCWVGYT